MPKIITLTLPTSADELGRFLETHNITLSLSCELGTYHVHLERTRVISYSDERGIRRETWRVSRYKKDLDEAIREAVTEMQRQLGAEAAESRA